MPEKFSAAYADDLTGVPLVSVIMNCYNGETYLREAIDSVLSQTYRNWELIFFDNASSDDTPKIVRQFTDQRIKYFRGEMTLPLGAARNEAIAKAKGEFMAFLDSDDRWLPEKLTLQIGRFEEEPDCGFIYSNNYIIDSNGLRKRLAFKGELPQGSVFSAFLRQYSVNLQTVMIRASSLNVVDRLFDSELELAEEYDLFMRMLYHVRATYIAQPLAEYRVHGEMSSIKKLEKYPVEYERVVRKFAETIPEFHAKYSDEMLDVRAKLAYYKARVLMKDGRISEARELLAPNCSRDNRYLALYLLTYLGTKIWDFAHRVVGRIG